MVPSYLNFQFVVDITVCNLIKRRTIHEWIVKELQSFCHGHYLQMHGRKSFFCKGSLHISLGNDHNV